MVHNARQRGGRWKSAHLLHLFLAGLLPSAASALFPRHSCVSPRLTLPSPSHAPAPLPRLSSGAPRRASRALCAAAAPGSEDSCAVDGACIYFVSGNLKKEAEVNAILAAADMSPFRVEHVNIDLPELQGDPLEICRAKVAAAAEMVGGAVLVEDTSLCFTALGGMPGPYIKWWMEALGVEGLYKLLQPYEDKSAYAQCTLGFSSGPGATPRLFVGTTEGSITQPHGDSGFGWDACFIPDGESRPFGEMSMRRKNAISHRARALQLFVAYCREHEEEICGDARPVVLDIST